MTDCYLSTPAILCSVGDETNILTRLSEDKRFLRRKEFLGKEFLVGEVLEYPSLLDFPKKLQTYYTRTNALLFQCMLKISPLIQQIKLQNKKERIGVCLATTTSGIQENFESFLKPLDFKSLYKQELSSLSHPAEFIREFFQVGGPVLGISTACTSGLKAIIQACRLIKNHLCDVVIAGGVDALGAVSLFGFDSLGILSQNPCNPFSANREGINIGEGACLMIVSRRPLDTQVVLESFCSNNDAFHLTKQDTQAKQAILAIESIVGEEKIDYVNLHATGTEANEIAESRAISEVLPDVYSGGIKGHMGHTLGASGAIEAGICCLLLDRKKTVLPIHLFDGEYDISLPQINLVKQKTSAELNRILSVNFAFGGDNVAAVFGRKE